MSAYKFLDESLLDNVETDDVEDVDIETEDSFAGEKPFAWVFKYHPPVPSGIRDYLNKILASSECVGKFDELVIEDDYTGIGMVRDSIITVRFYSHCNDFRKYCDLFVSLLLPNEYFVEINTGIHYRSSSEIVLNCRNGELSEADRQMRSDIEISSFQNFINFFKPVADKLGVSVEHSDICCYVVNALCKHDRFSMQNKPFYVVETDIDGVYLIDRSGKLVLKGFGSGYSFYNGYAGFGDDSHGYFYIGPDGKIDTNKFSASGYRRFSDDGFAVTVNKKSRENYIDRDWNLVSGEWFQKCYEFVNGFGKVKKDGKFNFIDKTGKLVSKTWFVNCENFDENGMVVVTVKDKSNNKAYNYMDSSGKLILDKNYRLCLPFHDGVGCVFDGEDGSMICNYVNKEGRFISDQWFVHLTSQKITEHSFSGGYACVLNQDDECNMIDTHGTPLFENWNKEIGFGKFSEGFCSFVEYGKGYGFIDKTGKRITDEFFDSVKDFKDGFAFVVNLENDELNNYINTKGELMLPWMDFDDINAYVPKDGLLFDLNGNCIDSDRHFVSLI